MFWAPSTGTIILKTIPSCPSMLECGSISAQPGHRIFLNLAMVRLRSKVARFVLMLYILECGSVFNNYGHNVVNVKALKCP